MYKGDNRLVYWVQDSHCSFPGCFLILWNVFCAMASQVTFWNSCPLWTTHLPNVARCSRWVSRPTAAGTVVSTPPVSSVSTASRVQSTDRIGQYYSTDATVFNLLQWVQMNDAIFEKWFTWVHLLGTKWVHLMEVAIVTVVTQKPGKILSTAPLTY